MKQNKRSIADYRHLSHDCEIIIHHICLEVLSGRAICHTRVCYYLFFILIISDKKKPEQGYTGDTYDIDST